MDDKQLSDDEERKRKETTLDSFINAKPRAKKSWSEMTAEERDRFQEESKPAIKWWVNLPVENERRLKEHEKAHEIAERMRKERMKIIGQSKKLLVGILQAACDLVAVNKKIPTMEAWKKMSSGDFSVMVVVDSIEYEVFGDDHCINQSRQPDLHIQKIKYRTFETYMTLARKPYKPKRSSKL